MHFHQYIFDLSLVVWLYMTLIFLLALMQKDNSIVDSFWGIGFIVLAAYSLVQSGEVDLRKAIVNTLTILWGLRLSIHIMLRARGRGEDFRYKAWRESWKFFHVRSYFQIFMLQGLFMLVISSPVWFVNFSDGNPPGLTDFIGLILFGTGFLTEIYADQQLTDFRKNPGNKGKLLTTGLWAVSRHPNYFGEALLWWGIAFYSLGLPNGWMTLISPLTITLLLRYVSGVPMLENRYRNHPGWEDYSRKTAPFVPWVKWF